MLWDEIVKFLDEWGVTGFAILAGWGLYTKKWVLRSTMDEQLAAKDQTIIEKDRQIAEAKTERDQYKGLVLRTLDAAEKVAKVVERDTNG